MSGPDQTSIVLYTMRSLKDQGSWCGETHVQKSLFLCQEIVRVTSGFKYVLYKHGPYSFELSEHLQLLISDDYVRVMSRPPYGPSLELSDEATQLSNEVADSAVADRIQFIAKKLNRRGVSDLERLATSVYINNKYLDIVSIDKKAEILNSIKSHVPVDSAKLAFLEIEAIQLEAQASFQ